MEKYVNLLPKEDQREIILEKINSQILNLFFWILISLVIVVAAFLAARFYVGFELRTVTDQIALQQQVVSQEENQQLKTQLSAFNTNLSNLVTLGKNHVLWSEIIINFARLVPPDVAIDSFSADRLTGNIKISGFAKNRESVLLLRKNLMASEYFQNVNFPLSNLVKPANLNFSYSFYVSSDYLTVTAGQEE